MYGGGLAFDFDDASPFAGSLPPNWEVTEQLWGAASSGDVARVAELLAKGADPLTAGHEQWTPLAVAVHRKHVAAAKLLLEAGPAAAGMATVDGSLPLHICAWEGPPELARLLLDAAPHTADRHGACGGQLTPLQCADVGGNAPVVLLLLEAGADPRRPVANPQNPGYLALMLAAWGGHHEVVRLLLAAAPDTATAADSDGESALYAAIQSDATAETVRLLAEAAPAMVSEQHAGWGGSTLLHAAVQFSGPAVMHELLKVAPGAARVPDSYQALPLHWAALHNKPALVPTLLRAATDTVWAADSDGDTPLILAARCGSTQVLQQLLEAEPQAVACTNVAGNTALHEAVLQQQEEAAGLILAAAPGACALGGHARPLDTALATRQLGLARLLIAAECRLWGSPGCILDLLHRHNDRWAPDPLLAPLYAEVAARLPLTAAEWSLVPAPCPGLAAALPSVLRRSKAEAGWLVFRLPSRERAGLRAAALALGRAGGRRLPAELAACILALAAAGSCS